jgi:hypothetical protein
MNMKGQGAAEAQPNAAHDREQLRRNAETRTAIGEVAATTLENRDVPARLAKQMASEKSADRSADDEGAQWVWHQWRAVVGRES